MKYADVILPLPLENSYTYRIPEEIAQAVVPGCRVVVHFGARRYYTAIVLTVRDRQPLTPYEIKDISGLLDGSPILRRPQLRFWEWISSYYLCKLGDVYKAALPSGLKPDSETTVVYNDAFEAEVPLRPNEQKVLDAFSAKNRLTVVELERHTGIKNLLPVITSLLTRGAVSVNEELRKGFKIKTESYIRLAEAYNNEEALNQLFDALKRAKKQEELLLRFLSLSNALNPLLSRELSRKELVDNQEGYTASLSALLKKGILESYEKEVSRLEMGRCVVAPLNALSAEQEQAWREIQESFRTKEVCLLHGVTSSGKTEIYARLMDEVLKQGRQVLYMLPEIAITTQITERLSRLFGDRLLVYHSKFSDNERVEVWNKLLYEGGPRLVLGVRSSIFLPFKELGLVIVDEEHENSYKQQDPAPRYHARNAAIVLAGMHGAKVLLGSATPSVDSYYNALVGKYGLVELNSRFGAGLLPEITTVDLKDLRRRKIMKESLFSPPLLQRMQEAFEKGEQVILFQNRRGFAPMTECRVCGWVPHCVNCDVSLTYHKQKHRLVCHYCGYSESPRSYCPACESSELRMVGFGTEKVEDELKTLFPDVKTMRMDIDTARTRQAYEQIIHDFEKGKAKILIGTQMVSKGLDFSNVAVVGILNADSLMNIPDFRAHERAFQLMVQVAGRAGRRDRPGVVVLQTSQPEHPLIRLVTRFDYKEMVNMQLVERKLFHYPPYFRLITLVIRGRMEEVVREVADRYARLLTDRLGDRVLGPVIPLVTRVQTLHIRKILLKIEIAASIRSVRELLEEVQAEMQQLPAFKQVMMHYDVDN